MILLMESGRYEDRGVFAVYQVPDGLDVSLETFSAAHGLKPRFSSEEDQCCKAHCDWIIQQPGVVEVPFDTAWRPHSPVEEAMLKKYQGRPGTG